MASHMSMELGVLFSQLQDSASGTGNREVAMSMPALIAATMRDSNAPVNYQYTIGNTFYDFSQAGGALHDYVTTRSAEIEASGHVLLVNALNAVRDFFGLGQP